MPKGWQRRVETSLNVSWEIIESLVFDINEWIIDIKDSNLDIYRSYTGGDGSHVYENVCKLSQAIGEKRLTIRIPEIPDYNTEENMMASMEVYEHLGNLDVFKYRRVEGYNGNTVKYDVKLPRFLRN
jgi:pyruvate formate lyase activating enzyme